MDGATCCARRDIRTSTMGHWPNAVKLRCEDQERGRADGAERRRPVGSWGLSRAIDEDFEARCAGIWRSPGCVPCVCPGPDESWREPPGRTALRHVVDERSGG